MPDVRPHLASRKRTLVHAVFAAAPERYVPLRRALSVRWRIIGSDDEIRVFDVQHIKGLEFEAVFFVGIDKLAAEKPSLFDKYLYVGATRAATYLGITCQQHLPTGLSGLAANFASNWSRCT